MNGNGLSVEFNQDEVRSMECAAQKMHDALLDFEWNGPCLEKLLKVLEEFEAEAYALGQKKGLPGFFVQVAIQSQLRMNHIRTTHEVLDEILSNAEKREHQELVGVVRNVVGTISCETRDEESQLLDILSKLELLEFETGRQPTATNYLNAVLSHTPKRAA